MGTLLKVIFVASSISLLVYLLMPVPLSVKDFSPLPGSAKSTLEGDTIQVPNVSAYFSNNYRDRVMPFYLEDVRSLTKFPFGPLRLNYPPEFAFTAIKDQTHGTFLEELVYPLRDSLFVNGLEPFEKDGTSRYKGATLFDEGGKLFETKVTLRYYPSHAIVRIATWLGINISIYYLVKVAKGVASDV